MEQFSEKTIIGEALTFDKVQQVYLGPNLNLKHCNIVLKKPATAVTFNSVRMIDCNIDASLKNFSQWLHADLSGCRFSGILSGNDFGHWREASQFGKIERCNFSDAVLDGCRFFNCSLDSIIFPPWPGFLVKSPCLNGEGLESVDWPGELEDWFGGLSWSPEDVVAIAGNAEKLIANFGGTLEEVNRLLKKLDFVHLVD